MQEWLRISILLCSFGFLKEVRPSEPFLTNYLLGDKYFNMTEEDVIQNVYPIGTYSWTTQLVFAFLLTDLLRYKPLIILSGLAGIAIWSMLLWTSSLGSLQIIELIYGTYMATEVAYYTYIYAKVEKEHYQKVSSHTRAAIMAGRFIAAVTSQIVVELEWMDYRELNYISLAAQILATVWAVSLPGVKTSLYFHRNRQTEKSNLVVAATAETGTGANDVIDKLDDASKKTGVGAMSLLWMHFRNSYRKRKVREWSLWYAMGMCGYLQIITYVQVIWNAIKEETGLWNGAVEALLTLLSAMVALLAGYLHTGFFNSRRSIIVLIALSMFEALAIYTISNTDILVVSYIGYLVFGVLYAFTITLASAEVAKQLDEDCFGLIFGFNTFMALALQTIITFLFVSGNVFQFDIFQQFLAYCIFFIVLGVIYTVALAHDIFQSLKQRRSNEE